MESGGLVPLDLFFVFRFLRLSGKVHIGLSGFQRLDHQPDRLSCGYQVEHGIFQQVLKRVPGLQFTFSLLT